MWISIFAEVPAFQHTHENARRLREPSVISSRYLTGVLPSLARQAAGAASARLSLRPLSFRGTLSCRNSDTVCRENAKACVLTVAGAQGDGRQYTGSADQRSRQATSIKTHRALERHADPQSPLPDNPASLSRRAVEHLKTLGQLDEFRQLQTGSARGVIDEDAFDHRRLGVNEDLGDLGNPAFWPLTCEQSRVLLHDRVFYSRPRRTGAHEAILLRRLLQARLSDRSILMV